MAINSAVTSERAIEMIPEKDTIHTYRRIDMSGEVHETWYARNAIIRKLKKHRPLLSGPKATAKNHRLVIVDAGGLLFIETNKGEDEPEVG